jgi:hypothetical protein
LALKFGVCLVKTKRIVTIFRVRLKNLQSRERRIAKMHIANLLIHLHLQLKQQKVKAEKLKKLVLVFRACENLTFFVKRVSGSCWMREDNCG